MLFRRATLPVLVVTAWLAGCGSGSSDTPAIGEAYVGPATLNLRKELGPRAPITATVTHGEKLDILKTRRRFVHVRTPQGAEGWTDGRLLLTPQQMEDLRHLTKQAEHLPSQGTAITYDLLNMHSEPNRVAPSFYRIPENAKLEVLAHRAEPRVRNIATMTPAVAKVKPPPPASRKPKAHEPARTLPMPRPPAPPTNWLELSRTVLPPPEPAAAPAPQPAAKPPVRMDDWYLVRTREGKVGWVLSRMLGMAIPDEVAQYAEGRRITSYFSLGEVHDNGEIKHNWVWTTMAHGGQPYEFDRIRVFIWSLRHHRYETAYMERDVKGYYPVTVSLPPPHAGKGAASPPQFSVVTEGDDWKLYRTDYALTGYRVQVLNRTPYARSNELADVERPASSTAEAAAPPRPSWIHRAWRDVVEWRHRWFK